MKNGIYTLIAVALVVGAIFYSSTVVLGKVPDGNRAPASSSRSVTHATLTSKKKQAAQNQNPAQAGASAAKPNGVPNCVACAPEQDSNSTNHNQGNNNNLAEAPEPGPSSSGQPQSNTSVNQSANAKAVAKGKGASAKAVAVNNTTFNNVTNTTVEKVQQIQPIQAQTPVSTAVPEAAVEQPVVAQTVEPVSAQVAAVPVSQPLPATGDLALSGLVGTSAIAGAAYSYIRSRRQLLRSHRKRQP